VSDNIDHAVKFLRDLASALTEVAELGAAAGADLRKLTSISESVRGPRTASELAIIRNLYALANDLTSLTQTISGLPEELAEGARMLEGLKR
jgi:hypothetical protein